MTNGPEEEPSVPVRDRRMNAALTAVAAFGVLEAALALMGWGLHQASGVALGAALATLNLWAFSRIGHSMLAGRKRAAAWALVGVAKLLALFGGMYLLLRYGYVEPLPLVCGYAALPFGITLSSVFAGRHDDPSS